MPSPVLEVIARQICALDNFNFVQYRAEGVFKETFEVQDKAGDSIALKVYRPEYVVSERTAREIDAMLVCIHSNVAKLFAVKQVDIAGKSVLYILEEFLSGGTLSKKLASSLLNRDEVILLGRQLIDAIGHIASRGIVHRDIKPDNIMFRSDATSAVIVDFGLVRDLAKATLTAPWAHQGPGSPFFAAPEQLNNEKDLIDWRTDQFALGVLFSISVFGFHPYSESTDSNAQVIERVAKREKTTQRFNDAVAAMNLPVLAKMVNPWPVARFRTPELLMSAWESQA